MRPDPRVRPHPHPPAVAGDGGARVETREADEAGVIRPGEASAKANNPSPRCELTARMFSSASMSGCPAIRKTPDTNRIAHVGDTSQAPGGKARAAAASSLRPRDVGCSFASIRHPRTTACATRVLVKVRRVRSLPLLSRPLRRAGRPSLLGCPEMGGRIGWSDRHDEGAARAKAGYRTEASRRRLRLRRSLPSGGASSASSDAPEVVRTAGWATSEPDRLPLGRTRLKPRT